MNNNRISLKTTIFHGIKAKKPLSGNLGWIVIK